MTNLDTIERTKPTQGRMVARTIGRLEAVLYAWACDNASRNDVKQCFRSEGWAIDLRQQDVGNTMLAFDADGYQHVLEV